MNEMKHDELEEALEHDAAIKGQQGGNGSIRAEVENPDGSTQVVVVDPGTLLTNLDIQQASLAKGVALAFTEIARSCATLMLNQLQPGVDTTPGGKRAKVGDTTNSKNLLDMADRALVLADKFSVLGDKADARLLPPVDSKSVDDSRGERGIYPRAETA